MSWSAHTEKRLNSRAYLYTHVEQRLCFFWRAVQSEFGAGCDSVSVSMEGVFVESNISVLSSGMQI